MPSLSPFIEYILKLLLCVCKQHKTILFIPSIEIHQRRKHLSMERKDTSDNDSSKTSVDHVSNSSSNYSGTRTIQRNRRGPMSRPLSTKSNNRHSLQGDRYDARPTGYSHYNVITTHADHDDTEVLIESALGEYNHSDQYSRSRLKSRKNRNGGSSNNNKSGRRSYAPLRGDDILSEEERNSFYHPDPESIFVIPQIPKEYKRSVHRFIFIMFGMLIYFSVSTLLKNRNHTENINILKRWREAVIMNRNNIIKNRNKKKKKKEETNVNIKSKIKNVFGLDNENGEDDMLDPKAYIYLPKKKEKKGKDKDKKNHSNSNDSKGDEVKPDMIQDDYIEADAETDGKKEGVSSPSTEKIAAKNIDVNKPTKQQNSTSTTEIGKET